MVFKAVGGAPPPPPTAVKREMRIADFQWRALRAAENVLVLTALAIAMISDRLSEIVAIMQKLTSPSRGVHLASDLALQREGLL